MFKRLKFKLLSIVGMILLIMGFAIPAMAMPAATSYDDAYHYWSSATNNVYGILFTTTAIGANFTGGDNGVVDQTYSIQNSGGGLNYFGIEYTSSGSTGYCGTNTSAIFFFRFSNQSKEYCSSHNVGYSGTSGFDDFTFELSDFYAGNGVWDEAVYIKDTTKNVFFCAGIGAPTCYTTGAITGANEIDYDNLIAYVTGSPPGNNDEAPGNLQHNQWQNSSGTWSYQGQNGTGFNGSYAGLSGHPWPASGNSGGDICTWIGSDPC